MKYSLWRPDRGGYDYYEDSQRLGLGDDLPRPKLSGGTDIGVASTDVGRRASGLRRVGAGALPVGSILPLSRSGLGALGGVHVAVPGFVMLGLAFAFGWWWRGRRARS